MGLRVAAYCRVSTEQDDQINSLHNQIDYFTNYIEQNIEWILVEVYADEGLSGTSTKKRVQFNRMLQDAYDGEIDLILTKEVSRFARNTVDTLKLTRKLKDCGVGVKFINDNIDTRDNDGEFRLSIMASVAQEESRKTSERVKWGQKRSMERGVVFGNNSTFGFKTKNGRLSINEQEAEVVKLIFHKFVNEGKGTHIIARELFESGIYPPKAIYKKWSSVMILRILQNEKYVGDLVQKKYITIDYLTHKKIANKGIEDKVCLYDHHEAIIDRTIWDKAQEELIRRSTNKTEKTKYSNRYWCSGLIKCGACGSRFVLRKSSRKNMTIYKAWGCHNKVHYGNWKENKTGQYVGCNMHMINEKTLITCVSYVLDSLNFQSDDIVDDILKDLELTKKSNSNSDILIKLRNKIKELSIKKELVMDSYFSKTISKDDMTLMNKKYDDILERLTLQMYEAKNSKKIEQKQIGDISDIIDVIKSSMKYSESVFKEIVEVIDVFDNYILIRIKHLPITFKLIYTTSGYKENYITEIINCETI